MAASASTLTSTVAASTYEPRFIDIGINLTDPIFRGLYHDIQRHPDDLRAVVGRAKEVGCTKLIVTGSSLKSSRDALRLAAEYPRTIFTTAGIHPCSSAIFSGSTEHDDDSEEEDDHTLACDPAATETLTEGLSVDLSSSQAIIEDLRSLIEECGPGSKSGLVAVGEFGLDYDRLHYCSKELQVHSFSAQLDMAASLSPQLPLFLHSRAAHRDFVDLLKAKFGSDLERLDKGGVVHSFTGTMEEMNELTKLGLYIGVNGCSLKTAENCAVVKVLDLSRIMLETDGPWCEVRPSHEGYKYLVAAKSQTSQGTGLDDLPGSMPPPKPSKKSQKKEADVPDRFKTVKKERWEKGSMVKGRNEPCMIERIAMIVAGIKGVSLDEVCEAARTNTVKLFDIEL